MAVYTEIGDDELRAFVGLYDLGEVLACKGIAEGVENSNFLLTTARGNFILTLYEKRVAPADAVQPGLADELAAELAFFASAWPVGLPTGVIHADLFPDNVFFRDRELSGLIDFYFACTDFLAYDLAVCLNAWCFEPGGDFNVTKARLLVGNYRAARPLTTDEIAALPLLARGSALRYLLTRLY